jgi:hypothetical protein
MNFIENLFCNNVAVFVYLCAVQFKKTIWYKQVTAILLLLILSSVTVIQLSHSHTSVAATQKKVVIKKADLPGYYTAAAENRCFICEYQLTRDADINHTVFNIDTSFHYPVTIAALYSFTYPGICSFIETRGPPSII